METLNKKILIVEDEKAIINGISDLFAHEGFEVLKAGNGQEGLDLALSDHPDMILLDVLMPDTDGFFLLENLRKDDWGKSAKVLMWSNSRGVETIERTKKLGVLDFLIKSDWEYRDIVKKIRGFLGL
jgi:DNA-binding response OmpR family regulator